MLWYYVCPRFLRLKFGIANGFTDLSFVQCAAQF